MKNLGTYNNAFRVYIFHKLRRMYGVIFGALAPTLLSGSTS
jgi:hypothetical protein